MQSVASRLRVKHGTVVAYLGLFVALGGVSYAAINLPAGSVGTKHLKRNAVISSKVKNGSLRRADFRAGQIPAGPTGPAGPAGATGPTGAAGATGPAGPLVTTLPSGHTLQGEWGVSDRAASAGQQNSHTESFQFPMASGLTAHYIPNGGLTPAGCTGSVSNPGAAPGHLCVFTSESGNVSNPQICEWSGAASCNSGTSTRGFAIVLDSSAAGDLWARGPWAATAP